MDDVDKVHRLQRRWLVLGLATPIFVFGLSFALGLRTLPRVFVGEIAPDASEAVTNLVAMLFVIALYIGWLVGAIVPSQRYYRELRDIKTTPSERRKRAARAIAVFGGFWILWFASRFAIDAVSSGVVKMVLALLPLAVAFLFGPVMIRLAVGTAEMDENLRRKLMEFARSKGVKVRDIRALRTRSIKQGNAVVAGIFPRFRYIFLTDYLIDNLEDDELLAVVAHEIGHAKKHHLPIKVAVPFLVAFGALLFAVLMAALGLSGDVAAVIGVIIFPIGLIAGLVVLQGAVALKLETSADDYACDAVGADATARALKKLADMNMTKEKTGVLFNLLTQHPAVGERIARIRARATAQPTQETSC